jgi:hypothetical protein
MAKRAPANETPYSPLDADLARSVMDGATSPETPSAKPSVVRAAGRSRHPRTDPSGKENVVEHPASRPPTAEVKKEKSRLSREKRVLLSAEEEREIERLVDRVGEGLGTSLKLSHLLRACMSLLCHAESELHAAAATLGPIIRPANRDAIALAQFESNLARLLSKALRDAVPIR